MQRTTIRKWANGFFYMKWIGMCNGIITIINQSRLNTTVVIL